MYQDYYANLIPDRWYHIFNRGNNREKVFYEAVNYQYFLGKYAKYTGELLDTYAYALLPNHFHLVVRARTPEEVRTSVVQREAERARLGSMVSPDAPDFPSLRDLESLNTHEIISEAFRRFFMAYAKAINK